MSRMVYILTLSIENEVIPFAGGGRTQVVLRTAGETYEGRPVHLIRFFTL